MPEPSTISQALQSPGSEHWKEAIRAELSSLASHNTWKVVQKPRHARPISTRFVFSPKNNADGTINRYKARLVVKGFMQGYVDNVYSPVVDFCTVRIILPWAILNNMQLRQLDIRTAFMRGEVDQEVYVLPPSHLEELGITLCWGLQALRLQKGLYGLKQVPNLWHRKWVYIMEIMGFSSLTSDSCVYVSENIWIVLYVDDIIVVAPEGHSIDDIVGKLREHFDVRDLGSLHHFFGISFVRNGNSGYLSQEHYVESVLNHFGMSSCKPVKTPLCTGLQVGTSSPQADEKIYREIIGALWYLSTRTRSDIGAAVAILARYVSSPLDIYMVGVKRILRYLRGSSAFHLQLTPSSSDVLMYADSDWGGDILDRKSTSGYVIQFGGLSVSWKTVKQKLVALSSTEEQFIAACTA